MGYYGAEASASYCYDPCKDSVYYVQAYVRKSRVELLFRQFTRSVLPTMGDFNNQDVLVAADMETRPLHLAVNAHCTFRSRSSILKPQWLSAHHASWSGVKSFRTGVSQGTRLDSEAWTARVTMTPDSVFAVDSCQSLSIGFAVHVWEAEDASLCSHCYLECTRCSDKKKGQEAHLILSGEDTPTPSGLLSCLDCRANLI